MKHFGKTIKKSVSMLRRHENTVKNIASGLEKRYQIIKYNFGSKYGRFLNNGTIKNLQYVAPQAVRGSKQLINLEGKKCIQMRSASWIRSKEITSVLKRAPLQLKKNELGSLINIASKTKPLSTFLFVTGSLTTLTQMTLTDSDLDSTVHVDIAEEKKAFDEFMTKIESEKPGKITELSKEDLDKKLNTEGKKPDLDNKKSTTSQRTKSGRKVKPKREPFFNKEKKVKKKKKVDLSSKMGILPKGSVTKTVKISDYDKHLIAWNEHVKDNRVENYNETAGRIDSMGREIDVQPKIECTPVTVKCNELYKPNCFIHY